MTNASVTSSRRNFLGFALASGSLGVVAATTNAAHASAEASMSDNEKLIRRLYDAVNKKDLEVIEAYGSPESEWLDVPFNYTSTGSRAILDPWKAWFDIFPDATCEVRSIGDGRICLRARHGPRHSSGSVQLASGLLPVCQLLRRLPAA